MAFLRDKRVLHCGAYAYCPDEPFGSGSFADVFRGADEEGNVVAIKRIARSKLAKGNNRKLLQSEISILQTLRHDNIVQLLGHHETSEHIFLIMEFCDGGDLATYVSRQSPMSEEVIALLLQQLVDALNYLNSKNVVHRDLKPHNILLRNTSGLVPQLKIADFGFARLLVEEDLAATFCGTPLYMAPEVLDGDSYRASADLFSLGAIIYQCYTGQPPYRATNIRLLKEMHHQGALPALRSDTSPAFRDVLAGLLQINPDRRMTLAQLTGHPFLPRNAKIGLPPMVEEEATVEVKDVDDRSYVLVDPAFVEVNTLADSVERRMRASPGSGRNPTELVALLEQVVGSANLVVTLANECLQSQPDHMLVASLYTPSGHVQAQGEALVLFAKALTILRSGLSNLRNLICRSTITVTPALYTAVQNLRHKFNECLSRIEVIRSEMSPAHIRGVRASADQLIYNHALALSREAAKGEACGNYSSSEIGYSKALALLRIIMAEAQGQPASINVESILEALTERRAVVAQRKLEQDALRTMRRPLAVPTEESLLEEEEASSVQQQPSSSAPPSWLSQASADSPRLPASKPIAIVGQTRHHSLRESTSPPSDSSPSLRLLEQKLSTSSPSLPPGVGMASRTSPLLKKAAFCGNCGSPFNSQSQKFCTVCGALRHGTDSLPQLSSPP